MQSMGFVTVVASVILSWDAGALTTIVAVAVGYRKEAKAL